MPSCLRGEASSVLRAVLIKSVHVRLIATTCRLTARVRQRSIPLTLRAWPARAEVAHVRFYESGWPCQVAIVPRSVCVVLAVGPVSS
jgi:hypothetical protein